MSSIDKKTLEYLAGLSRIEIKPEEEDKLVNDLEEILNHFSELKEVDTTKVEPMNGGTLLVNSIRGDDESVKVGADPDNLIAAFPQKEEGFLKIPPVFE